MDIDDKLVQSPYLQHVPYDRHDFPYKPTSPVLTSLQNSARVHPSHTHIFSLLLTLASISSPPPPLLPLYPPVDLGALAGLLAAINATQAFDELKKDCLVLYLLRDWEEESADKWAKKRAIPFQFRCVTEGYWLLDHGQLEAALTHLVDPRITVDFAPHVLHALANKPQLVLRFIRHCNPVFTEFPDLEVQLIAMAETNFGDAWHFVQGFPNAEDGAEMEDGDEEPLRPTCMRYKLVNRLIEWCLIPKPRLFPLQHLLALPLSPAILAHLTHLSLHPPTHLPPPSLPILQTLLHTRLLQLGAYSDALELDRQFAARAVVLAPKMGELGGRVAGEAARARRAAVHGVVGTLPRVERLLLEERYRDILGAPPQANGDMDMDMDMDAPARLPTPAPSPQQQDSPMPESGPLSASQLLRTSHPASAVLHAFASSIRVRANSSPSRPQPQGQVHPLSRSGSQKKAYNFPGNSTSPRASVSGATPVPGSTGSPFRRLGTVGPVEPHPAAHSRVRTTPHQTSPRRQQEQEPSESGFLRGMQNPALDVSHFGRRTTRGTKRASDDYDREGSVESVDMSVQSEEQGEQTEKDSRRRDRPPPRKRASPNPSSSRMVRSSTRSRLQEDAIAEEDSEQPQPKKSTRASTSRRKAITPAKSRAKPKPKDKDDMAPEVPMLPSSPTVTVPGGFPRVDSSMDISMDGPPAASTRRRTRAQTAEEDRQEDSAQKSRRTTRAGTPRRPTSSHTLQEEDDEDDDLQVPGAMPDTAKQLRRSKRLSGMDHLAGNGHLALPVAPKTPAKGKGKARATPSAAATPSRRRTGRLAEE